MWVTIKILTVKALDVQHSLHYCLSDLAPPKQQQLYWIGEGGAKRPRSRGGLPHCSLGVGIGAPTRQE